MTGESHPARPPQAPGPPQSPGPQRSPGSTRRPSTAKRIVLGCAIGCGALALLALVAVVVTAWYFIAPGQQSATAAVVGPESLGGFRHARAEPDPGLVQWLDRPFVAIDRAGHEQRRATMPENLRWLDDLGRSRQQTGSFGMFMPREATLSFEPGPPEADENEVALAVNLRAFPRFARFLLNRIASAQQKDAPVDYRGHAVTEFPGGSAVAFHGGTLLFAGERSLLEAALDQVIEDAPAASAAAWITPERDAAWDVYGELDGESGAAWAVLGLLAPSTREPVAEALPEGVETPYLEDPPFEPAPDLWLDGLDRLFVGVDLASADLLRLRLEAHCADPEAAAAWQTRLARDLQALQDRGEGLQVSLRQDLQDLTATVEADLTGVEAWTESLARKSMASEPAVPE